MARKDETVPQQQGEIPQAQPEARPAGAEPRPAEDAPARKPRTAFRDWAAI